MTRSHTQIDLRIALLGLSLAAILAAGCSGQQRAAPVDPDRAREALETMLTSWKNGGSIDKLKTTSPAITAQDFDWMNGFKLVDYQIDSNIREDDANLRIPVQLTLLDPKGREIKKTVRYVVGTSPSLTVFREMF